MDETTKPKSNFVRDIINEHLRNGRFTKVHTRFPPEPNGYLHIGHAKSIHLNFGLARDYQGLCNLRMDDTNPETEDMEYANAIKEDVRWLGFDWEDRDYYASDYYAKLYEWAVVLIKKGVAYVCDQSVDQVREYRGTVTKAGQDSPFRNRSVEENLDLFARMRAGEFPDGSKTLRAKIDMANPNMLLRDPLMYRIRREHHYRTGDEWCIYPTYDWAHGQSDSIEGVTHSICTLEFEVHRPLYDWYLDQLGVHHPQQIEFARLNLSHTVLSKRRLLELVESGLVSGWDDPRMPTISGFRRRGFTPESIANFADIIGVAKDNSIVDMPLLEMCVRENLNRSAPRVMAVLRPLKVVITNYPEGKVEEFDAVNNPEDASAGARKIPFSREIWLERDDFMENPPPKFYRLSPGREVRLRYAYFIKCEEVVKDAAGNVVELRCTYDPATRGGDTPPDGRKVKATLHWVSAAQAIDAEVRLYDTLFTVRDPGSVAEGVDWKATLNPKSVDIVKVAKLEPSLASAEPESRWQFERLGYFCTDRRDSKPGALVFNRTVTLRDEWARIVKAGKDAA
ncbi:MAG: glutamine--tRNA ligase/YqeY domain fusion protein [Candidatus Aminicenantes bacterium]|nr:MAG: glutamine--tRNA ligase/YqeY domain fusion protein [Candidatus Aminicenantes bacterium]